MLKNHALAQSIQDVGWRLFLQKLQMKGQLLVKNGRKPPYFNEGI